MCKACNETGYVPVMSYYGLTGKMVVMEALYVCKCPLGHDLYCMADKEITDDDGKRKTIKVKKVLSQRYFDVFQKMQFTYSRRISEWYAPGADYHTIYLAGMIRSVAHFKETGEAKILDPIHPIEGCQLSEKGVEEFQKEAT